MRTSWQRHRKRARAVGFVAVTAGAVATWYIAVGQVDGLTDVLVFVPSSAVLGLAGTWAAHAVAPHRFTWRRGLIGAVGAALLLSPLAAAVVTFLAAWQPGTFLLMFIVGAWVALASGLVVGVVVALARWALRRWRVPHPVVRLRRRVAQAALRGRRKAHRVHVPNDNGSTPDAGTPLPDSASGYHPTPADAATR